MIQICICQALLIHICIMDSMMRTFKNNKIAELRKMAGLSQRKLAEEIGTSQANLSRWEQGLNEPSIMECWRLAEYFNVTIDYLSGKSDY